MPQPPRLTRALLRIVVLVAAASLVMGACGSAAVRPSAAATTPGPSSATPSGTASSSASLDVDAIATLDAFRAFIQADQSFHMTGDMQLTIDRQLVTMAVAEDVSGRNETGTLDFRGTRLSVHMAVVILHNKAYLKVGNRKWQRVAAATSSTNPTGDLRVDGLKPIDIVNVGGVPTHHFRADGPASLDPAAVTGNALTNLKMKSASFDVYVNNDGVPLLAKLAFSGTGTFQGKASKVEAKVRYDFSRFGVPVKIVAPI